MKLKESIVILVKHWKPRQCRPGKSTNPCSHHSHVFTTLCISKCYCLYRCYRRKTYLKLGKYAKWLWQCTTIKFCTLLLLKT